MHEARLARRGLRRNLSFPHDLYAEMKDWAKKHNMSISELCREAIQYFMQHKRREIETLELAETCRIMIGNGKLSIEQWSFGIEDFGDSEFH